MYLFTLPLYISFLFLYGIFQEKEGCWRSSVLSAAVVWGIFLTAITELLSLPRLLTFGGILLSWTSICIVLGLIYFKKTLRKPRKVSRDGAAPEKATSTDQGRDDLFESRLRYQCFGVFVIIAISGLIALVAPPNINDALSYHLPRVIHWTQNQSVAHYPTNFVPQLFLSPWSAYAILHLHVLSGGDQYVTFVQWFSMLGSLIGVSLVAKQLGATPYGQVFASIFCATIPMGILQSSSTQNDYVAAFWLVCLVHYVLRAIQKESNKFCYLMIGFSLGLALLTKGTTYLYSFPFLVWLLIFLVRNYRFGAWKPLAQVGLSSFAINAFLYWRNFEVFRSPLGKSPDHIVYTNKVISIPTFLSNIIRNVALHFSTPSSKINQSLIDIWTALHSVIDVDINDPRTSSSDFQLNSLINHGDFAGNPIHLSLIFISIICFGLAWKRFPQRNQILSYLICIISGFLLFCLLLAWTPFHTRLHLSLFVLLSVFVGRVLSTLWNAKVLSIIASLLVVLSFAWLLFNENKPVIANSSFLETGRVENIFNSSRLDSYFLGRPDAKEGMLNAVNYIKSQQCQKVGMSFDRADIIEYPLLALLLSDELNKSQNKEYVLRHVGIDNVSEMKYEVEPFKGFAPCLIYDTYYGTEDIEVRGNTYARAFSSQSVNVYRKQ